MAKQLAMGIDLGTSNSCVAIVEDGVPKVIANEWGERTHASVVSFLDDGGGAGLWLWPEHPPEGRHL